MKRHLPVTAAAALLAVCGSVQSAVYPLPPPGEDLVGQDSWTRAMPGDTFATIAYRHGLGFRALIRANPGIDPWKPHPQQPILLPGTQLLPDAPREGIVINVPEMRLYYYPEDGARVFVFPVAVGRLDWKTPLGVTAITSKVRNPVWYPPETIRAEHAAQGDPLPEAVPAGPDNPLGHLALRLGWPLVLIHGTNMPMGGIGMPVTHGCVRLYPQDIETLFGEVPPGTMVNFIEQPQKLGRHDGHWYLEAHPPLSEDPHADATAAELAPSLVKLKTRAERGRIAGLDWERVHGALRRATGVPTVVDSSRLPPASAPPPSSMLTLSTSLAHPPNAASAFGGMRTSRLLALGLLVLLGLIGAAGIGRWFAGFHRGDL